MLIKVIKVVCVYSLTIMLTYFGQQSSYLLTLSHSSQMKVFYQRQQRSSELVSQSMWVGTDQLSSEIGITTLTIWLEIRPCYTYICHGCINHSEGMVACGVRNTTVLFNLVPHFSGQLMQHCLTLGSHNSVSLVQQYIFD